MRISRRSANSVCIAGLVAVGVAAVALAQDPPNAQVVPSKPGAQATIGAEGDAAMERMRAAVTGRKSEAPIAGPAALPPSPDAAARRHAFDAMRRAAPTAPMDRRARAALDRGRAGLATEREVMAKRLGQVLGLDAPDMKAIAGAAAPIAANGWVPVLFVSSSMPIATLRTYAGQLERVGGVLAFRGMPGGLTRVAPMARLSAAILRRDPGCSGPACVMRDVQVIVDPLVFRQHGVSRVPALAMIPGDPTQPYCEREDTSPRASHIVYGDAALSGLLESYARLGKPEEVRDVQRRLERR